MQWLLEANTACMAARMAHALSVLGTLRPQAGVLFVGHETTLGACCWTACSLTAERTVHAIFALSVDPVSAMIMLTLGSLSCLVASRGDASVLQQAQQLAQQLGVTEQELKAASVRWVPCTLCHQSAPQPMLLKRCLQRSMLKSLLEHQALVQALGAVCST